jgi:hypothetical protein
MELKTTIEPKVRTLRAGDYPAERTIGVPSILLLTSC